MPVLRIQAADREALGILVGKTGGSGILLTTASMAAAFGKVQATLLPAGPTFQAKVRCVDWRCGLATLEVSGAGLPAPGSLAGGAALKAGEAGSAPGGEVRVQGEKTGLDGEASTLVLAGPVSVRERGGPILDAGGRLAGILTDHIVDGRSATAVSASGVSAFLAGRPVELSLDFLNKASSENRSKYKAALTVSNPAGLVQALTLAFCRQEACPDPEGLRQGKTWKRLEKPLVSCRMSLGSDGVTAAGEVLFSRTPKEPALLPLFCQAVLHLKDGREVVFAPAKCNVQFLQSSLLQMGGGGAPVRLRFPEPPLSPEGVLPELPGTLAPSASLPLNAIVGGLNLSPDGETLFVLDLTTPRIVKVQTSDLAQVGEIPLEGSPSCMVLSGGRLYVGIQVREAGGKRTGKLLVFSEASLEPKGAAVLPLSPGQLVASASGGLLYAVPEDFANCLAVVEPESLKVSLMGAGPQAEYRDCRLLVHPDSRRLVLFSRNPMGSWYTFRLKSDLRDWEPSQIPGVPCGKEAILSCGGMRLLSAGQGVRELTSEAGHYVEVPEPKLPQACCVSTVPGWDALLLCTDGGVLKVHELSSLALLREYVLPGAFSVMCPDPVAGRLYAVLTEPTVSQKSTPQSQPGVVGVRARLGTLVAYPLDVRK